MSRSEASETLLICDGCTSYRRQVRSGTAVIDTTILADQVLELRISQGQVHVLRRRKAEDQFPNWELMPRLIASDFFDGLFRQRGNSPIRHFAITI
jgi:hypothetical protein